MSPEQTNLASDPRTSTIAIVGAGWEQAPIIQRAKEIGLVVVAIDGDASAPGFDIADRKYVASTRDFTRVVDVCRAESVDAVTYMITESAMVAVHRVATCLNLPGPSLRSVEASVDKRRMREMLAESRIPDVTFAVVQSTEEAQKIVQSIGLPVLVKPVDGAGQVGVSKVEKVCDLEVAVTEATASSRINTAMIEEWLTGPELNAVGMVINGTIVSLTLSDREKYLDFGAGVVHRHIYPCSLSTEQQSELMRYCQTLVEVFEVRNGIVFPQIIYTTSGPRVVDFGERVPGGMMKELFELATGYDLLNFQLDVALNRVREASAYRLRSGVGAVVVKFINAAPGPLRPGNVSKITGMDTVKTLPPLMLMGYFHQNQRTNVVRPLRTAKDRFFFVISAGETRALCIERCDLAASYLDFLDEHGKSLKIPTQPETATCE